MALSDRLRALPLSVDIDAESMARLEILDALLTKWVRAVALIGFRSAEERARRYFAEALQALRYLPFQGPVHDIGSGGGSPSLPMAVMRPSISWHLFEANEKKALFLEEAVRELGLPNVEITRARYEDVVVSAPPTVVTCRGVKLSVRGLDAIFQRLQGGGRFLWFSAEARLREASAGWAGGPWEVLGLTPLLPGVERSGWLMTSQKP